MGTQTTHSREVERLVVGQSVSDGAGVKLSRVLTQDLQRRLDPFLMLDEFRSDNPQDYLAGFPDHPHRGFETVTYMIAGNMRHRDSAGHEGLLKSGGVQWMTAGRGVIHSELPEQENGLMHGFQLWINLPSYAKMQTPGYRDIPTQDIPQYTTEKGVLVRVIAGESQQTAGAIRKVETEPLYLDIHLPVMTHFNHVIPAGCNAFLYVYAGEIQVGQRQQKVKAQQMAILSNLAGQECVDIYGTTGAKILLLAGKPLNEPIAQWGPFVMNTREEIEQTLLEYRTGQF